MVFTACSYLALAGAVWVFLRLIQACFWLPRHLKKQNDVQAMLQEKVESYEKYILECEEKEKSEQEVVGEKVEKDPALAEKWKERRECLEMLKRELRKVRDNSTESYDWESLLEEEDANEEDSSVTETEDNENSKDKSNKKVTAGADVEVQKEVESDDKKDK